MRASIDLERIALDDREGLRPSLRKLFQCGNAAPVALNGDDMFGAGGQQSARQAARAGANFQHGKIVKRAGRTGDFCAQVGVEKKMLAE